MEDNKKSNLKLIAGVVIIAAVIIAGAILLKGSKAPTTKEDIKTQKTEAISLDDALKLTSSDVVLGDVNAPVTYITYGDYQCPFCGRFFTEVETPLMKDYVATGKVKFVFRGFQFLGEESTNAGLAAECAKDQGKFSEYHDALYTAEIKDGKENNGNLNKDLFVKLAVENGLDKTTFTACYDNGKYLEKISQDAQTAAQVGINTTPISFVNGKEIKGLADYKTTKTIIDSFLK